MSETDAIDLVIIGGAVVGNAIAYKASLKKDKPSIVVIEKNANPREENQSSRNSGVIHAGIYYDPNISPLKASLCVPGNRQLYEFCEKFQVPNRNTGKLVVATNEMEVEYLEETLRIANLNGVPGVKLISGSEAKSLEPNVNCTAALHVPTSGIIESTSLVTKLYQLAQNNGVDFLFGNQVVDITPNGDVFDITVSSPGGKETFQAKTVINSAGLYSDAIAKMVNPELEFEIRPERGEVAKFPRTKSGLEVHMNVYPAPYGFYVDSGEKAQVPLEEFKRLLMEGKVAKTVGVHITPVIGQDWKLEDIATIGPAKTIGRGKEDYGQGLRSTEYFFNMVRKFFPNLKLEDIQLHNTGIMAAPKGRKDWVIERDQKYRNMINLFGIESPGLTACLSIADYVNAMLEGK